MTNSTTEIDWQLVLCHSSVNGDSVFRLSSNVVLFNIRTMLGSSLCSPALQRKESWPLSSLGSSAGCGRTKECRRVSSDHESISSMIQQPSKCTWVFGLTLANIIFTYSTFGLLYNNLSPENHAFVWSDWLTRNWFLVS